jgi:hypothetical protein
MKATLVTLFLFLNVPAFAINTGFPMPAAESPADGSLDTHKDDKNDQVRKSSDESSDKTQSHASKAKKKRRSGK